MNEAPPPTSRLKSQQTPRSVVIGCLALALFGSLLFHPRQHVPGIKRRPAPTPTQHMPAPRANSSRELELICSHASLSLEASRPT